MSELRYKVTLSKTEPSTYRWYVEEWKYYDDGSPPKFMGVVNKFEKMSQAYDYADTVGGVD